MVEIYRAVDALVGRLVEEHPEAAVMALSFHGMGPNHSDLASMALLPELLYRHRFGDALMRNPGAADELMIPDEAESWSDAMRRSYPSAREAGNRQGNVPGSQSLTRKLRRAVRKTRSRLRGPGPPRAPWTGCRPPGTANTGRTCRHLRCRRFMTARFG